MNTGTHEIKYTVHHYPTRGSWWGGKTIQKLLGEGTVEVTTTAKQKTFFFLYGLWEKSIKCLLQISMNMLHQVLFPSFVCCVSCPVRGLWNVSRQSVQPPIPRVAGTCMGSHDWCGWYHSTPKLLQQISLWWDAHNGVSIGLYLCVFGKASRREKTRIAKWDNAGGKGEKILCCTVSLHKRTLPPCRIYSMFWSCNSAPGVLNKHSQIHPLVEGSTRVYVYMFRKSTLW